MKRLLPTLRAPARWLLAVFFVVAGSAHFLMPKFYLPMMPPWLPAPEALIFISGVFEILGGLAVLVPRLRVFAGVGLIALLLAVFPANLHVAFDAQAAAAFGWPRGLMIARLPLQFVFVAWVWWCCLAKDRAASASHDGTAG